MAIVQIDSTNDVMVSQQFPDANQDGNGLNIGVDALGGNEDQILIEWPDLTVIPAGATILTVRIALYVLNAGKNGTFPIEINVKTNDAAFDEAADTWNTRPAQTDEGISYNQQDIGSNYWKWIENAELDGIVAIVQDWLDTPANNHGIVLVLFNRNPGELQNISYQDREAGFAPIIEIEYYTATTVPGADPGDDTDTYESASIDRLDAQYGIEPAHEVLWTVDGTEHDLTDQTVDLGQFRTKAPFHLETRDTGEAAITFENEDKNLSPEVRSGIIYLQNITGTEIEIRSGLALPPNGRKDLITQYRGLADFLERDSGNIRATLKCRGRIQTLSQKVITITYANEVAMDALYDIVKGIMGLADDEINSKTFFDADALLGASLIITAAFVGTRADVAAQQILDVTRSSLYTDRRGRLAIKVWESTLTATGDEILLQRGTNLTGLAARSRDDLIINRQQITWGENDVNSHTASDQDSINGPNGLREGEVISASILRSEDLVVELGDEIMGLRANAPTEAFCEITEDILRIDAGDQVVITSEQDGWVEKVFVASERLLEPTTGRGTLRCLAPAT